MTILVGAGACAAFAVLGALYPDLPAADARKIIDAFPDVAKRLFGDPSAILTTFNGWLNLEVFHMTIWLIGGGLASVLGAAIVAKEVETRDIEVILSLPVARPELIVYRFAAAAVLLVFLHLFMLLGIGLSALIAGEQFNLAIVRATIAAGALSIVLGSIALLCGLFFRQVPTLMVSWIFFGTSFVVEEVISRLVPALSWLSYLSVFQFYDSGDILLRGACCTGDVIAMGVLSGVILGAAVLVFSRKDIHR